MSAQQANQTVGGAAGSRDGDDQLTAKHTAFPTMQAMLDAKGGYRPSLHTLSARTETERMELAQIADAYDAYQAARGDHRRAYRS